MKGFKDWFIAKHGFWPATQHELVGDVLSRLCNEVAEFVDSATGRGDYAEIEPVPAIGKPVKLELIRIVSETPVPSHGGPAAGVAWELRLNGVLIESSYDRYDWFDRDKKGLKPPSTLTRIRDELANALNVSAVAE